MKLATKTGYDPFQQYLKDKREQKLIKEQSIRPKVINKINRMQNFQTLNYEMDPQETRYQ